MAVIEDPDWKPIPPPPSIREANPNLTPPRPPPVHEKPAHQDLHVPANLPPQRESTDDKYTTPAAPPTPVNPTTAPTTNAADHFYATVPPTQVMPVYRYNYSTFNSSILSSHLYTGTPFILQNPRRALGHSVATTPPLAYASLPAWSTDFKTKWQDVTAINMWQGRLSLKDKVRYMDWEDTHVPSFENFDKMRSEFTNSYLSAVANDDYHKKLIQEQYDHPSFLDKSDYGADSSAMWMYGGQSGAGVLEHIDTIGCVCSWSQLLFGRKKWLLRSPPGSEPEVKMEVVQEAGDFIFWCVGWWHQTVILSDAVDVHGYTKLRNEAGSFAREKLRRYATRSNHRDVKHAADVCEFGFADYVPGEDVSASYALWRRHRRKIVKGGAVAVAICMLALLLRWLTRRRKKKAN